MVHFKFIEDTNFYEPDKSFFAVIDPNVKTRQELLQELYSKLQFPDYFGFNWDALFDCLRDFHWIKEKGVILIHPLLPRIERSDLIIYLEILNEAILDWKVDDEHYLECYISKIFRAGY